MNTSEKPWVEVADVCDQYGLTFPSAKQSIVNEIFPVPTYKVGRKIVIDREVHKIFFELKREAGLLALKNNLLVI